MILPELMTEEINGDEFKRLYSLTEPWNGPNNSVLTALTESRYTCPCGPEHGTTFTSYVVIVGPNTLFPGTNATSMFDLPESADPILVLEITDSDIHWAEPRDLPIEQLSTRRNASGLRVSSSHGTFRYITVRGKLGELHGPSAVDEIKKLAEIAKN